MAPALSSEPSPEQHAPVRLIPTRRTALIPLPFRLPTRTVRRAPNPLLMSLLTHHRRLPCRLSHPSLPTRAAPRRRVQRSLTRRMTPPSPALSTTAMAPALSSELWAERLAPVPGIPTQITAPSPSPYPLPIKTAPPVLTPPPT